MSNKCYICPNPATREAFIDGIGDAVVCTFCGKWLNTLRGMNGMLASGVKGKRRRKKAYLRKIVAAIKDTPCSDCGIELPSKEMTFDHLPEFEKSANVGEFITRKSRRNLLLEIAKCDVVCRPCHDKRERKRGRPI